MNYWFSGLVQFISQLNSRTLLWRGCPLKGVGHQTMDQVFGWETNLSEPLNQGVVSISSERLGVQ